MRVLRGEGCYSTVGVQNFGNNTLSIGPGCEDTGIMLHELGHAFGFMHEHQRADRDHYITVLWENIQLEWDYAYAQLGMTITEGGSVEATAYDFGSLMHYGNGAFSSGGPTFTVKPGFESHAHLVGNLQSISALDGQGMAMLYGGGGGQGQSSCPPDSPFQDDRPEAIVNYCVGTEGLICAGSGGYAPSLTCHGAPGFRPHGPDCAPAYCTGCACAPDLD